MSGIPESLLNELREVLLRFEQFGSNESLKVVFVDRRINVWHHEIPETNSVANRVDQTINFFQERKNTDGKSGLILFLKVLQDKISDNDYRYQELDDLAQRLSKAIPLPPTIINLDLPENNLKAAELTNCPYQGLFAFRPEHAHLFFGREKFTKQLLKAIKSRAFTAVLGPSGSGKSSVVMAGLVPKLYAESKLWQFITFRPKDDPFDELASALVQAYETDKTDQSIAAGKVAQSLRDERDRNFLSRIINQQVQKPNHQILLIADQFEELYTQSAEADIKPFINMLLYTLKKSAPPFKVLLTMRADFLEQAASYGPLADILQDHIEILSPMTRSEMRAAIEQPALNYGRYFEDELVKRILEDVGHLEEPIRAEQDNGTNELVAGEKRVRQPKGGLPLLEFALTKMWEHPQTVGHRTYLTYAAYNKVGRIKGALSEHAKRVYSSLSEAEKEQARRIFINLVTPGQGAEDTRRVATAIDLKETDWTLVTKLATQRLVVTNKNEKDVQTVEVVHEALIRNWPQLRHWLDTNREFLLWRQGLQTQLELWHDNDREKEALLRGTILAVAHDWLETQAEDLTQPQRTYIQASFAEKERQEKKRETEQQRQLIEQQKQLKRERKQNQFNRIAATIAVITTVVMAILLGNRLILQNDLEQERDNAIDAQINTETIQISLLANTVKNENLLEPALLLASEAISIETKPEINSLRGQGSLLHALLQYPPHLSHLFRYPSTYGTPSGSGVSALAFHPTKPILATSSDREGEIILWDVSDTPEVAHVLPGTLYLTQRLAFSPDGQQLIVAKQVGGIYVWDLATYQEVKGPLLKHDFQINSLAVTEPNAPPLVASGDAAGQVILWDPITWQAINTAAITSATAINSLAFSPDGASLIVASDRTITVWNVQHHPKQEQRYNLADNHAGTVKSLALSTDGRLLASGDNEGRVNVWKAESLSNPLSISHTFKENSTPISKVMFDPDDKFVISSNAKGQITFWNLTTGESLPEPLQGQAAITDLSVDSKGLRLASSSEDGSIALWDIAAYLQPNSLPTNMLTRKVLTNVTAVVGLPKQPKIIIGQADGSLKLWESVKAPKTSSLIGKHLADYAIIKTLLIDAHGENLISIDITGQTIHWDLSNPNSPISNPLQYTYGPRVARSFALSPDGRWLAVGSTDGNIRLVDTVAEQGKQYLIPTKAHNHAPITALAFSPDGKRLASGSTSQDEEDLIALWNVEKIASDPALSQIGDTWKAFRQGITTLAFSSDGSTLATGQVHDSIILWDVNTQSQRYELFGDKGSIDALAFLSNNRLISSGSDQYHKNTIMLWDVVNGERMGTPLEHGGTVETITAFDNGQQVAWLDDSQQLFIFDANPDSWRKQACHRVARNLTATEWRESISADLNEYRPTCSPPPYHITVLGEQIDKDLTEKSEAAYVEITSHIPPDEPVLLHMACFLGGAKALPQALAHCEQALTLIPNHGRFLGTQAAVRLILTPTKAVTTSLQELERGIAWYEQHQMTDCAELRQRWHDQLSRWLTTGIDDDHPFLGANREINLTDFKNDNC